MKNNEFRKPLIQSAVLLAVAIFIATLMASSGSQGSGGSAFSFFAGIGYSILFILGMAISLSVSIALLIGIFLAAVAMVDPEQARQMYSDLKKNFKCLVVTCRETWACCAKNESDSKIDLEVYTQMKQELIHLQNENSRLSRVIQDMEESKILFLSNINELQTDNAALELKIEDLGQAVQNLQHSENAIKALIDNLTTQIQSGSDEEMLIQIQSIERMQAETRKDLEILIERLNSLESCQKQATSTGIFSYIQSDAAQNQFIECVAEALKKEMTYAQIDDYLSAKLPPDLDKIVKEHPALTKNYIRSLRRD